MVTIKYIEVRIPGFGEWRENAGVSFSYSISLLRQVFDTADCNAGTLKSGNACQMAKVGTETNNSTSGQTINKATVGCLESMVEWNSGMEYWNDLLSLQSDVWGCYELQHVNVGTSHQSFLEKWALSFQQLPAKHA